MADVGTQASNLAAGADRRMDAWWQRRKDFAGRSLREQLFGGTVERAGPGFIGPVRRFEGALEQGYESTLTSMRHNVGWDYFGAATKYTKTVRKGGGPSVLSRVQARRGFIGPRPQALSKVGLSQGLRTSVSAGTEIAGGIARRVRPLGGVIGGAFGPGFIAYGAAISPHGQLIGGLEEYAGWSTFGAGMQIGKGVGGWLGGSVASGASKLPMIGKLLGAGEAAAALGAGAGAVIGGFATGLIFFEAARWSVGFALHTLPTFAKQFQRDMGRSGFGGDFVDSAGAATMRQRSLQVIGKSFANARSALGQEASLLHV